MTETKTRSASKSIIWRIMGVIILATVTYAYTKNWITTGLVTVIHHATFLVVFYMHERIWLKFKRPKNLTLRSIAKMFTYEIGLGNIILGIITYLIVGGWKSITSITLTYIGIKCLIYVLNEFVWKKKVKWGLKKDSKQ